MTRALWLPFEVTDLDTARAFYTEHLGMSVVDGWDRDGERGVVLRAAPGASYLELVSSDEPKAGPMAFELDTHWAVDNAFERWRPPGDELLAPPHRYPRGHYGFEVRGPAGARVMVWSEK
ncbi:MAG TPA: VOC family protein [Pseudonocardiaceae bacterium]|jgi:catechol 2,3-dioxygenase-like lactoylglutathione lyase family enzyme|nr:VOC family protein [Pseudonocardiaceae bacterium]